MSKFRFEVNELALAVSRTKGTVLNCEIIAVPGHNIKGFKNERHLYIIDIPENRGKMFPHGYRVAEEKYLRKKKPPEQETGTWEQIQNIIGWNPIKEKVYINEKT